ncbi:MAG TPA: RNA polymerase sigma factor [Micropepsaceae bacterium]|nr:RNA polymerase sigma factor [Micropepsaceae bacterium]
MSNPGTGKPQAADLTQACCEFAQKRRGGAASGESEDVAQDACLKALQSPSPERIRDPIRYLFRVSRNLVIDRLRRGARETLAARSLAEFHASHGETFDPERSLAAKQELRRVLASIDALPPRCREAFKYHRFDGLSYAAIARRMKISTSMVEKHIAEAMVRITRALREDKDRHQ